MRPSDESTLRQCCDSSMFPGHPWQKSDGISNHGFRRSLMETHFGRHKSQKSRRGRCMLKFSSRSVVRRTIPVERRLRIPKLAVAADDGDACQSGEDSEADCHFGGTALCRGVKLVPNAVSLANVAMASKAPYLSLSDHSGSRVFVQNHNLNLLRSHRPMPVRAAKSTRLVSSF